MKKFFQEFKQFAMRGNVTYMAVGFIVGAAFTAVVNSLVGDLIMPCIGVLVGGVDFSDLAITLKPAVAATATSPAVPEKTEDQKLLEEIRDILKENKR